MRALLVASLALLPLAASAPLGHEPPPRTYAQEFPLRLDAVGLREAALEWSDSNCVVIRAQGHAAILGGRATVTAADEGPGGAGRLLLRERASSAGVEDVAGALPLAMELAPFELRGRDDAARVGVHLTEGALAAAAGQRVDLRLVLHHVGAPIHFALEGCAAE